MIEYYNTFKSRCRYDSKDEEYLQLIFEKKNVINLSRNLLFLSHKIGLDTAVTRYIIEGGCLALSTLQWDSDLRIVISLFSIISRSAEYIAANVKCVMRTRSTWIWFHYLLIILMCCCSDTCSIPLAISCIIIFIYKHVYIYVT